VSLGIVPSTSEERKQLVLEILYGKTDKVSKITDNSVVGGFAAAISKVSGKAEKDIIQALSKLFPDNSSGSQLDQCAITYGIAPRFQPSQSSVYIRIVGNPGTQYVAGTHTFISSDGIQFDIEETSTISNYGYNYVKVRSVDVGLKTNVKPATINKVNPIPTGHLYCVNEYQATGGRDLEDDINFRQRIKDGANVLARGTIAMLEQAFMLINSNVLRLNYQGINSKGQLRLAIVTQNGIDLNANEINTLLTRGEKFFGLSELRPFGKHSYGIELVNIQWQPYDVSFRCELLPSANPDLVRIDIQTKMSKYTDFRYFNAGVDKIEWDNLLQIAKNTKGMKYIPDEFFYPRVDIPTDPNKLPRLRGFAMLNLNGGLINTFQGTLNPVYYPTNVDFSFQQTVLRNI